MVIGESLVVQAEQMEDCGMEVMGRGNVFDGFESKLVRASIRYPRLNAGASQPAGKSTTYEAGPRIPFLVRWPGVSKPMRSSALVSTVDVLPTILDAAGATTDIERHGRSLRPVLEDADAPWREYLVGEHHMHGPPWFPQRAIRDNRFKLIHSALADSVNRSTMIDGDIGYSTSREERYAGTDIRKAFDTFAKPPEFELNDLKNDPWEFHNLAGKAEYAEVEQRLKTALEVWQRETDDPALNPAWHDKVLQTIQARVQASRKK